MPYAAFACNCSHATAASCHSSHSSSSASASSVSCLISPPADEVGEARPRFLDRPLKGDRRPSAARHRPAPH
eukprot:2085409-Lingulodinium_polyedra.AAC.3